MTKVKEDLKVELEEEVLYVKEKELLLKYHAKKMLVKGVEKEWKISAVQSVVKIEADGGKGKSGIEMSVILCSGELCTKKIYCVYDDGTVA